jgi:hypothetical protein
MGIESHHHQPSPHQSSSFSDGISILKPLFLLISTQISATVIKNLGPVFFFYQFSFVVLELRLDPISIRVTG